MATVGDFYRTIWEQQRSSMMFGYTDERRGQLSEASRKVRQAIKEENNRDTLDLDGLPYDLVLGEAAQAAYQEFLKVIERPGGCAWPVVLK
jgi:hypothetical protein